jgi:predicted lipid carrier protein YhbT
MTGNRMPRKTAEIISEMMAIDIALTFMIEYVQTAVIVLSNIDNKAAIAPMNQFTLTHMYREEAEMLRDDLIKRLETDANLSTTMKNAMDL